MASRVGIETVRGVYGAVRRDHFRRAGTDPGAPSSIANRQGMVEMQFYT